MVLTLYKQTLLFSECYYVAAAYREQDFVASVLRNCATLVLVIVATAVFMFH
jgi:hypothetical protein